MYITFSSQNISLSYAFLKEITRKTSDIRLRKKNCLNPVYVNCVSASLIKGT